MAQHGGGKLKMCMVWERKINSSMTILNDW